MRKKILTTLIAIGCACSIRAQMVSVNTDVAMDALMAPNIGFEMVIGERSTIGLNALYTSNPWWAEDPIKATFLQPEYRYYFSGRPMAKWFVGVGVIAGVYDVTWKDKVYDGYGGGAGLTFGYVLNLGKRLNIDFHSGFGAFTYRQKEYFVGDNYDIDYTLDGAQRANASGYFLLPTRFGISVTYILK